MTKQQHSSIDGFVPRRANSQLGDRHVADAANANAGGRFYQPVQPSAKSEPSTLQRSNLGIGRADLDESLNSIDAIEEPGKGKKRRKGAPKSKRRRIIKWIIIVFVALLVAAGGWLAYKALHAGGNIFKGNIFDLVQNQPLKQDANGRSNILVLGTSQDDPGHDGSSLTDSMMIISIDQKNKNAYMISVPRDLQVQYNESCNSGTRGKINEYFNCVGGLDNNIDTVRSALTKEGKFVGDIFGLDVQYGVNVNYTVMRELVNAVGGITVTIESSDPNGQMDSNFDWKCGVSGDRLYRTAKEKQVCPPNGHYIDYPNGPVNLDAEHALYLAQARGDHAPTYGFPQSNFDREKNQQKILKAIREKAMSAGVLTDFSKVSSIIDALGDNLRTTFETSEFRTLVNLAKDIKDKDIQSVSLIDGDDPVMTTGMVDGQSVVLPSAGAYNYSALKALIQKKLSNNPVTREGANIVVLNGAGVAGVAKTEADKLTSQGFIVSDTDNAPDGTYGDVEIYQIGTGMAATKAKLESVYKVKVKTTASPVSVANDTNFVVIIGKDRSSN